MPRRWPRLPVRVRSRIWQQLTAIVLACALPLTIATAMLAVENNRRIEFTRTELRGLAYLTPLTGLLADVSLHRTLYRQVQAGERTLADRELLDARIDAGFAELVRVDASLGGYLETAGANPNVTFLMAKWRTWRSVAADAQASEAVHGALMAGLRSLITYIGSTSHLVLDPELPTYYLADSLLAQVPDLIDRVPELGVDIETKAAAGPLTVSDRIAVRSVLPVLTLRTAELRTNLETAFRDLGQATTGQIHDAMAPLLDSTDRRISYLISETTSLLSPTAPTGLDRVGYQQAVDESRTALVELSQTLLQQERRLLDARQARDGRKRAVGAFAILAAVVVTVLLTGWLSRRITRGVGTVAGAASALAAGDLTGRVTVRTRDEIGAMGTAFNAMADRLAELAEQQEQARHTLRAERDFVDAVVDAAGSLVVVLDPAGRIVRVNRACEVTTGYPFAELSGRHFRVAFQGVPDLSAKAPEDFPVMFEETLVARDGGRRYVAWSSAALLDAEGRISHVIVTGLDITPRRAVETELREAQERFRQAFDNAAIGMCLVGRDMRFIQVNPALCAMLGYPEEQLLRLTVPDVTHPDQVDASMDALRDLSGGGTASVHLEKQYLRSDGQPLWARVSVSAVHDESGAVSYFVTQIQDDTQRRAAEELLVHRAMHDPLTGLPNRVLLTDRLALELERSRRHLSLTAVLFVDLDGFKTINDNLGHDVGDQVLVEVSQRLRSNIRPSDTAARLGGDEFVILCPDMQSEENVRSVSARLARALAAPIVLDRMEAAVTASIGVALDVGAQETAEDLIRDADAAMYNAKSRGKNRFDVFDASLRQAADNRVAVESMLRRGLREDLFRLHFQPVIDLRTGTMIGVESLLRLDDPDDGLLAPGRFIQVAEETGLIVPIGGWVLGQACRDLVGWRSTGAASPTLHVAVNLSARQVARPDLTETIRRTLDETGLEPPALVLELTESMLMHADRLTLGQLQELRELGMRVGIDDFGTGYSSLSYLKRLPVDFIKVDRSFIAGLVEDRSDREIVTAVIRLGQALGLTVIAEGVEDAAQLTVLRQLGCDQAQGYFLGRPQPGPPAYRQPVAWASS
jgi:diguanylate cyclase (GGDEF)-like protein/PAS domain S-box-containing protein